MWRDDGTRSAVKQSYRRVTVLSHGIPSLLSFLFPAKLPCHRRGDGREGRWCLHDPAPALVNQLFHVLGGPFLITNYIIPRVDIGLAANENTRLENKKCLSDEYKFILIIYRGFACNLTMGVLHMLRWGAIVYTPCA
jgi:hypothetical protein